MAKNGDLNGGLALHGIRKAFQRVLAVDDLTFTVPRGSMFGLLGANGAGKTTTLRMVLGILRPDAGNIAWNGVPADDVPRHAFGYLPEERGLYPKMKVGELLVFLAGLYDLSASEATSRAHQWLERVDLSDAWNRKIEELSKGNQQKVQVLGAILHDPDLMLLDEPFSGLDPINTEILRDTLVQRQAQGHTIVFSSHRLEQVEELCDRVAIIHHGRLLAAGFISDLKRASGKHFAEVTFASPGDGATESTLDLDAFVSLLALRHPGSRDSIEELRGDTVRLDLSSEVPAEEVLRLAVDHGPGPVQRFEIVEPTLQEIFLAAVAAVDPEAVEQLAQEGAASSGTRKVLTEG